MKVKIVQELTGNAGKTLKEIAEALGVTQESLKETVALLIEKKVIFKVGTLYTLSPKKSVK
jgi:DNA-binding Lrp family transcriptional regulator